MKPQPIIQKDGVPSCTHDCHAFDGKRCALLGFPPNTICEPAVAEMAAQIIELKAELRKYVYPDGSHHEAWIL